MKQKKKLTVLEKSIIVAVGFFVLGNINGYNAGKAAAEAKIKPIIPMHTELQALPQENEPQAKENELESLGEFTLTAYCACTECCGKSDGITATGEKVQQGVTIAVDPNVIPYGTTVVINGNEYIAQDTMAKRIIEKYNGRIIDVYFDSHTEAFNFGRQTAEVFVKH